MIAWWIIPAVLLFAAFGSLVWATLARDIFTSCIAVIAAFTLGGSAVVVALLSLLIRVLS